MVITHKHIQTNTHAHAHLTVYFWKWALRFVPCLVLCLTYVARYVISGVLPTRRTSYSRQYHFPMMQRQHKLQHNTQFLWCRDWPTSHGYKEICTSALKSKSLESHCGRFVSWREEVADELDELRLFSVDFENPVAPSFSPSLGLSWFWEEGCLTGSFWLRNILSGNTDSELSFNECWQNRVCLEIRRGEPTSAGELGQLYVRMRIN